MRGLMQENIYVQSETNFHEMKVILQFPKQRKNEEKIRQDIKAVLISALQAQLQNIAGKLPEEKKEAGQ